MSAIVKVVVINADQWTRLRDIRLDSLKESAFAFGGSYEAELQFSEIDWRAKFEKLDFLIAVVDGVDAALMSVEELDGDYGATCWIGACWSNPNYRGKGLMRAMFSFVDLQDRNWGVQGLGVWTDNYRAISVYEALGFVKMGVDNPSTRQPGKFFQKMIRMRAC